MNKKILAFLILMVLAAAAVFVLMKYFPAKHNLGNDSGDSGVCQINNCHGLDVECGSKPLGICTEVYQMGDNCRQFVECSVVGGKCRAVDDPQFAACKGCVETCVSTYMDDQVQLLDCEKKCTAPDSLK